MRVSKQFREFPKVWGGGGESILGPVPPAPLCSPGRSLFLNKHMYIYICTCVSPTHNSVPVRVLSYVEVFLSCLTGAELEVPVHVFGPETHMTAIVSMALGKRRTPKSLVPDQPHIISQRVN